MFDRSRIKSSLERIEGAIALINANTASIRVYEDFLTSQQGVFTLSGVCMQLICIGENVKSIDSKTSGRYLSQYSAVPWSDIKGLRDIIAHEYQHIDAEEIFNVIKNDLPVLLATVRQMILDLPRVVDR